MRQRKVSELVLDFAVYPRVSVDTQHIGYMKESLEAGVTMPPVVICAKSLRVVDGFHRVRSYMGLYGAEHMVEVIEKKYRNDAELLADAMRFNAFHGRTLNRFDRVHCVLLAEKYKLTLDQTAAALGMTVETLGELRTVRVAEVMSPAKKLEPVPLKRTIQHMAGKTLTPEQMEANRHLSGMNQLFYVNQVISLIENDLLDLKHKELLDRLKHLAELIRKLRMAA